MLQKKTAYRWAGGLKAALGVAGVDNAGPVEELVGLPSAEASVSAAPLIQKKQIEDNINESGFEQPGHTKFKVICNFAASQ